MFLAVPFILRSKYIHFPLYFLFFFCIRSKLEFFEQACSVDSVTKKCAGRPSSCRQALLGILGTVLRTTCACQGADQQLLYRCLGWRKLLWVNPCVGEFLHLPINFLDFKQKSINFHLFTVEAQKDFHMKRLAELGLLLPTTVTTMSTTSTTTTIRPTTRPPPPPTIHFRRTTSTTTTTTRAPEVSDTYEYLESSLFCSVHHNTKSNYVY